MRARQTIYAKISPHPPLRWPSSRLRARSRFGSRCPPDIDSLPNRAACPSERGRQGVGLCGFTVSTSSASHSLGTSPSRGRTFGGKLIASPTTYRGYSVPLHNLLLFFLKKRRVLAFSLCRYVPYTVHSKKPFSPRLFGAAVRRKIIVRAAGKDRILHRPPPFVKYCNTRHIILTNAGIIVILK